MIRIHNSVTNLNTPYNVPLYAPKLIINKKWSRPIKAILSILMIGFLSWPFTATEAGNRVSDCGGLDQRPCNVWEAIPSCDLTPFLYQHGVWPFPATCKSLWCGGIGERPCTIVERIPSCEPGAIEEPLFAPTCSEIDTDGFPSVCGDDGEPACTITSQIALRIRSCKPDHVEKILTDGLIGTCYRVLDDGYPDYCGGANEPACSLDLVLQLGIQPCKPGTYNWFEVCYARDRDGYPFGCGDANEPTCSLFLVGQGINACKPGLIPELLIGDTCIAPAIDSDFYPTFCGGDNEQACDIIMQLALRVGPCKPGLQYTFGLPGHCDLVTVNEPGLGTTAIVTPSDIGLPVWGYADVHNHMFAYESMGGGAYAGKAFHPYGVAAALEDGQRVHGLLGLEDILGNGHDGLLLKGHDTSGWPDFSYWPRWNSVTHMQHYHRWLERAFLGGQRLMVMFAMNNEYGCKFTKNVPGYTCADMEAVDKQLDAARKLVEYIDGRSGGDGRGWFQIAESPRDAREIIAQGKMAVVLGIEIDTLFGCRENECDAQYIEQQLEIYYNKGVRHIFPIHGIDNAFGGAAVFHDVYNVSNLFINHKFLDVVDCQSLGLGGIEYDANMPIEFWLAALMDGASLGYIPTATYPAMAGGHCNAKGLTPLGRTLIEKLMDRSMIIDIEHMGFKMKEEVLAIAEGRTYPLTASHVWPLQAQTGQMRSEEAITPDHIQRIVNLGGLVAPLVNQWGEKTKWPLNSELDDCQGSSREFAQVFNYLVEEVSNSASEYPAIALGTDFHGFTHQPAPRFGPDGCSGNPDESAQQTNRVEYPFPAPDGSGEYFYQSQTGNRTFNYNTDGLAHVGLLPDFIEDLKNVGVSDDNLKNYLFRSAEAYIQMWERAVIASDSIPPEITPPGDLTVEASATAGVVVDYGDHCIATDDVTRSPAITYSHASGSNFPFGNTVVTCTATDEAGNSSDASFTVYVVDTTPPVLTPPANLIVEANGNPNSTADIGEATATDIFKPVTISNNVPVAGFPLGTTDVIWTATDANGNSTEAIQKITVQDTTPPVLTPPPDLFVEASALLTPVELGQPEVFDIFLSSVSNNAPVDDFTLGTTLVTWAATDTSGNNSTAIQRITVRDTTPPVLTLPPNLTVEATGPLTMVDIGQATATDLFGPPGISHDAPVNGFPLGTTAVTWTATDTNGNSSQAIQQVTLLDRTAPTFKLDRVTDSLWPPKHRLELVAIVSNVFDAVDPSPTVNINVISSEPGNGHGDGNTTNDWEVRQLGDSWQVWLRAERSGKSDGRQYTIYIGASDASGNQSTATHIVTVAHDQGKD